MTDEGGFQKTCGMHRAGQEWPQGPACPHGAAVLVTVTYHCRVPPWAGGKERLHWNLRFPWITRGRFGGEQEAPSVTGVPAVSPRCGCGPFKGSDGGSAARARLLLSPLPPPSRDPPLPARARPFRATQAKMVGAGEAPPATSGPIRRHPRPIRASPAAAALLGARGFPGGRGMGLARPAGTQRGGNGAEGRERPGRPRSSVLPRPRRVRGGERGAGRF